MKLCSSFKLVGVGHSVTASNLLTSMNPMPTDDIPQKGDCVLVEFALLCFEQQTVLQQSLQDLAYLV